MGFPISVLGQLEYQWTCSSRHCFVAGNPVTLLGALSDAGNPISGLVVMLYN